MKRTQRRLLWTLGIALALVAVLPLAGYLALTFYNVNRLKPRIEEAVSAQTGRQFVIHGDLAFTPGWAPTVKAQQLTLSNPEWAKEKEFASVGELEVTFQLMPLIRQRDLVLDDIRIRKAELQMEEGKGEQKSWIFTPAKDAEEEAAQAEKASGFSFEPRFPSVALEDVTLYYRKGKAAATKLHLPSATLKVKDSIALDATYDYEGVTGKVTLSGESLPVFLEQGGPLSLTAETPTGKGKASFDGKLITPSTAPGAEGTFEVKADTLAAFRPFSADLPETDAVSLQAKGKGTAKRIDLASFQLGLLPEGPIKGKGSVMLGGTRPKIQADITLPGMVQKEGPSKSADGKGGDPKGDRLIPDLPLPVAWMKAMDATLNITMPRYQNGDIALQDIRAKAAMKDGQLSVAPFSFTSFEGNTEGTLNVDANPNPPQFALKGTGRDWLLDRLIRQPDDGGGKLQGGRTQMTLDLQGRGNSLRPVVSSLQGMMAFHVTDLSYRSPGAAAALTDFIQLLRGKAGGDIKVKCALGRFDVANGVATSKALGLNTSGAIVTGTGTIDLGEERINLVLSPRAKVVGLADLAVPVQFAGNLRDPDVRLDPQGTVMKVGEVALGIATGGVTLFGKSLTDKLGVTADRDPCKE